MAPIVAMIEMVAAANPPTDQLVSVHSHLTCHTHTSSQPALSSFSLSYGIFLARKVIGKFRPRPPPPSPYFLSQVPRPEIE